MTGPGPDQVDVDRYLERIGLAGRPPLDRDGLEQLQRAHMTAVPFENLDVYHRTPVTTDLGASLAKVVDRRRGGWCFELNGAFAALLDALGFAVMRIGAAVLLRGPTDVVDHLALEVTAGEPYLVDVGFGDGFIRPLALNRPGPQDGGTGTFELVPGAAGVTLTRLVDGVPEPQYRFKRVAVALADLEPASRRLQADTTLPWHQRGFATRLLDGGPDRVTLIGRVLRHTRGGEVTETPVADGDWTAVLQRWFALDGPMEGPPER